MAKAQLLLVPGADPRGPCEDTKVLRIALNARLWKVVCSRNKGDAQAGSEPFEPQQGNNLLFALAFHNAIEVSAPGALR